VDGLRKQSLKVKVNQQLREQAERTRECRAEQFHTKDKSFVRYLQDVSKAFDT